MKFMRFVGNLRKMRTELETTVQYELSLGNKSVRLNDLLGKKLAFTFTGIIECIACKRETKKSFNQGYCYPCFKRLAACDICIVRPEKCHFSAGTCREPDWAQDHCMVDHIVYLANTSGVKVGITRANQTPARWIDQGASQAKPIARVKHRHVSGMLEVLFANYVADRTAWQTLLKGPAESADLEAERLQLMKLCLEGIDRLSDKFGVGAIQILEKAPETSIQYPVIDYPKKIKALNFDKVPKVFGALKGIKGQYLIFDSGVLNVRKFSGYAVELEVVT